MSPTTVMTRPTQSALVRPYVSVTSCDVGTTTIRFGASRYGPFAPLHLPVREVRLLDLDRLADLGDVERDLVDRAVHVADLRGRDASSARRSRGRWPSTRCQSLGPRLRERDVERVAVHPPRRDRALPRLEVRLRRCRVGERLAPALRVRAAVQLGDDRLLAHPDDEIAVATWYTFQSLSLLSRRAGDRRVLRDVLHQREARVLSRPSRSLSGVHEHEVAHAEHLQVLARTGRSRLPGCRTRGRAPGSTDAASTRRR